MAQRHVQKYKSGKNLLKALTDNPELPTFIPTLPASGLKTLIDEVGKEDAGMLIEHSTPAQLITILDESVWKTSRPGTPDKFDPDEFLEWLGLLLDIGDEFAVERMLELDEELLVAAFSHYFEILDLSKKVMEAETQYVKEYYIPGHSGEMVELVRSFEIKARDEEAWEIIQPLIAAMQVEDADLLDAVLNRCSISESLITSRGAQYATADAEGQQRDRRKKEGFVNSEDAGGFLRTARKGVLGELASAAEYDLETQLYFKRSLQRALDEVRNGGKTSHARLGHTGGAATAGDAAAGSDVSPEPDAELMRELESIVQQVELDVLSTPVQLIAGPGAKGVSMNPLQRAMNELAQSDPESLSRCMDEAAYLSNVLMTGARIEDRGLDHKESVAAVMATCNLGLEFAPDFDISSEPGLVGVFRIGWHLLHQIPVDVVNGLVDALGSDELKLKLGVRGWMLTDMLAAVSSEQVKADLENARFEEVREVLHMLSLVLEENAVEHIERLVDHLPMTVEQPDGEKTRLRRRFIETEADLIAVQAFVGSLQSQIRS